MKTLLIFALHILILSSRSAWGFDFRVTNNADSGFGSLRQAIIDLNASEDSSTNTVTFEPGLARISLLSDLPILNSIRKKTLQIINSLNFSYKFC